MCPHCAHSAAFSAFRPLNATPAPSRRTALPAKNQMAEEEEEKALLAFFQDPPVKAPPLVEPNVRAALASLEENPPKEELRFRHARDNNSRRLETEAGRPKSRDVEMLVEPEETYGATWRPEVESQWSAAKPKIKRLEKLVVSAAVYIAAALTTGALVFMQIEHGVASTKAVADQEAIAAAKEREREAEEDRTMSLERARKALSQPTWTELLPYVRNARTLLPEIRDYYRAWPYRPVEEPDLIFLRRVEQGDRVFVHLKLDAGQPWSRLVIMEKVKGEFKLDWEAFQRLRSREFQKELGDPLQDEHLQLRLEELRQDHHPFFQENEPRASVEASLLNAR